MDPIDAYRALRRRVDEHEAAAVARGADLRCGAGCEACCHVELSVSSIEASELLRALLELDADAFDALVRRVDEREATDERDPRCVMLGPDGRCAVYDARPLVCRSQGLPLAYPSDLVPLEAVRARAGDKSLVWCPLNFTERPPTGPDLLDAGRLDEALATLNRAFFAGSAGSAADFVADRDGEVEADPELDSEAASEVELGGDPLARFDLRDLVSAAARERTSR